MGRATSQVFPQTISTWIGMRMGEGSQGRDELNRHVMSVYAFPLRVYFLGTRDRWHPVQAAFEDAQAAQCGYCLSGMVMQAAALLARDPQASEGRIRSELSGNLCRCGTHIEILDAVQRAAVRMRAEANP